MIVVSNLILLRELKQIMLGKSVWCLAHKKCSGNVVIDALQLSENSSSAIYYPNFQQRLLKLRDDINDNNKNNDSHVWRALACNVYFSRSISTYSISLGSDSWKG